MGFLNEIQNHRYRTWKSICLSLSFATIGFHSALFGPSFIDLAIQVETTMEDIVRILPLRAFGNMIGSTLCGFVLVRVDHQYVLLTSLLTMSLSIFFVPFCPNIFLLYAVMIVNGMSSGFLCNAGNCFIIHQWGKENSPFMQMAHFTFGLGAFFSPFIAEPFLFELKDFEAPKNGSDVGIEPVNRFQNIDPSNLRIKWAFFIIGILSMMIWTIFFVSFLIKRDNKPHPTRQVKERIDNENVVKLECSKSEDNSIEANKIAEKKLSIEDVKVKTYHKVILVLLSAIFIHLAYGLELSFGVMLPPYARLSELKLNKTSSSFVASLYWACFTFFRLCTVVLINYISARAMLFLDLSLVIFSNLFLLPFLFMDIKYEWMLWVGSALMGIGVSSIYPTLWSFLEEILPVTSKMTSVVNSCGMMGEFIVPVLIGFYIESYPNIFVIIVFIYSAGATIIFIICVIWEHIINNHKKSCISS